MFPEPKNNWQPSASLVQLQQRAQIFSDIRAFFKARQVLEVDTPLLCRTSVPDIHIDSVPATIKLAGKEKTYYLQTSPEYAMKRLLAAYRIPIFQLGKAFRQEELGKWHQIEFCLLEWYRIEYDHHQLMDEVEALLTLLLKTRKAKRCTYQEIFMHYLNINPHTASIEELQDIATEIEIKFASSHADRDTWLNLLMSHYIEPKLGRQSPTFVYDFPASFAALARIREGDPPLASRFEVYVNGMELANGFHELQDSHEQRRRFEQDLSERQLRGLSKLPIDEYLLAALDNGLPDCAGVALGVDRLLMLQSNIKDIKEVLPFDFFRV